MANEEWATITDDFRPNLLSFGYPEGSLVRILGSAEKKNHKLVLFRDGREFIVPLSLLKRVRTEERADDFKVDLVAPDLTASLRFTATDNLWQRGSTIRKIKIAAFNLRIVFIAEELRFFWSSDYLCTALGSAASLTVFAAYLDDLGVRSA